MEFCTAQCTCLRSTGTVCKRSFGVGAIFFHFPGSAVIAFDARGARVEPLSTVLTLSFPSEKKGIAAPTEKNQAGRRSCRTGGDQQEADAYVQEDATAPGLRGASASALHSSPFPPRPPARRKRYTITPGHLKWDHFNLTYKILSFPRNLINARDTRKGLAAAFRMWSEVSPFSFKEVPRHVDSDLKIGFYSINHTDCLESLIHHCFDGTTGELAHAFFPPNGEIHFDDHEYWILGNTRFSWKKGVWLTDLVHVAAHEIGHALGLMHSLNPNALMHINATLTGKKTISQDEVWGIQRLYGCRDRLFMCPSWARKGFCETRRKLMKKHCPSTCDFCYEFPFPTVPPTLPPPRTKTKTVSEGRNVTFRCGQKIIHKKGKVYWYKDKELLEYSYPGYLSLNEDHMSIIANAINEGTYTCIVKKKERILTTYSWRIRLRH
ncbi:matrix metalloproteinase-23 isoform X1 [Anser cygnoides]|uniref:matrix metalloproteinase-23 isoform X1 n=1 Tax=Anser cygnoides TaxID=8845 RepID=UPI0034D230D8